MTDAEILARARNAFLAVWESHRVMCDDRHQSAALTWRAILDDDSLQSHYHLMASNVIRGELERDPTAWIPSPSLRRLLPHALSVEEVEALPLGHLRHPIGHQRRPRRFDHRTNQIGQPAVPFLQDGIGDCTCPVNENGEFPGTDAERNHDLRAHVNPALGAVHCRFDDRPNLCFQDLRESDGQTTAAMPQHRIGLM